MNTEILRRLQIFVQRGDKIPSGGLQKMIESLPAVDSSYAINYSIWFDSCSEQTLYLLLNYLLKEDPSRPDYELPQEKECIFKYAETLLKNIHLIDYSYPFEPLSKVRIESITRLVYNLLAFSGRFLKLFAFSTYTYKIIKAIKYSFNHKLTSIFSSEFDKIRYKIEKTSLDLNSMNKIIIDQFLQQVPPLIQAFKTFDLDIIGSRLEKQITLCKKNGISEFTDHDWRIINLSNYLLLANYKFNESSLEILRKGCLKIFKSLPIHIKKGKLFQSILQSMINLYRPVSQDNYEIQKQSNQRQPQQQQTSKDNLINSLVKTTLERLIRKRNSLQPPEISCILSIILEAFRRSQDGRKLMDIMLYFSKSTFKMNFLLKQEHQKHSSPVTKRNYQKLHDVMDALTELIVKCYIKEFSSFGIKEFEKNQFFCLMNNLIEEIIEEEITVGHMQGIISSEEVSRAIANPQGETFSSLIIPTFQKINLLITHICVELQNPEYTKIVIELIQQKFPVRRLLGECKRRKSPIDKEYFLDILKTLINLSLLNNEHGMNDLEPLLSQIMLFILQSSLEPDEEFDQSVSEVLQAIFKKVSSSRLIEIKSIIVRHLSEFRSLSEHFESKPSVYRLTVMCLNWIYTIQRRIGTHTSLSMADKLSQSEMETYMQLWAVILLDYPKLSVNRPHHDLVFKIAIFSPPLVEMTQRFFTNTIISFDNFQEAKNESQKKYYHTIRKILKQLFPKSETAFEDLSLYNLAYLLGVGLTLHAKIEHFSSLSVLKFGDDYSLLLEILSYLNNYLLYSGENSQICTALEAVVKEAAKKYIDKLQSLSIIKTQLKCANRDFIVLSQLLCSETQSFNKICRSLMLRYTVEFPVIFYNSELIISLKSIFAQLLDILESEYSLNAKILTTPFYSLNTKLPTDSLLIKERLTMISSALIRLYLRSYPMNQFLATSALEFAISNSQKSSKSEDYATRFLVWLNQYLPRIKKVAGLKSSLITLWINSKEQYHKKLIIDFRDLPAIMKTLYTAMSSNFILKPKAIKQMVEPVVLPIKRFVDDFIEGLKISSDYLNEKYKSFNRHCFALEYVYIYKLNPQFIPSVILPQTLKKGLLAPLFDEDKTQENGGEVFEELSKKIKKMITEDFSFFLNLMHSRIISNVSLLDSIVVILSMYKTSAIFEIFFTDFMPNFFRESLLGVETTLEVLQKLVHSLVIDLDGCQYQNIYEDRLNSQNVLEVKSPLFKDIYDLNDYQEQINRLPFQSVVSQSIKLRNLVNTFSPSMLLKYPYIFTMETETIKCLDYLLIFLSNMQPAFMIMESRQEGIVSLMSQVLSISHRSSFKFPLLTFCKLNIIILDFLASRKEIQRDGDRETQVFLNSLAKSLIIFDVNYFGKSIYSEGKENPENFTLAMNELDKVFAYLCQVYQALIELPEMTDLPKLVPSPIYSQYKQLSRVFQQTNSSYLSFINDFYTINRIQTSFKLSGYSNASHQVFLNIYPQEPNINVKVSTISKVLAYLVSDELENVKANFFNRLKSQKNPNSLELTEFTLEEFSNFCFTILKLNPLASLSFLDRFKYTVKKQNTGQDSLPIASKVLGEFVHRQAEHLSSQCEFLEVYVDYHPSKLGRSSGILFYWRMPHIPVLLNYIGKKYSGVSILSDYFYKMMFRIQADQLTFYLNQVFQSLQYESASRIESFLLKYASQSQLLSHQLIWLARVEKVVDNSVEHKKKNKNFRDLPSKVAYAKGFETKIVREMNMHERKLWVEVDGFFNRITAISSILKPQMEKSLKKKTINEELETIMVPDLAYLPTNPNFKVISIQLGSGSPMQSAAKCPIRVTFNCRAFEGPDLYFSKKTRIIDSFSNDDSMREFMRVAVDSEEPAINPTNMVARVPDLGSKSPYHSKINNERFERQELTPRLDQSSSQSKPFVSSKLELLTSFINPASRSLNSVNKFGAFEDSLNFINTTAGAGIQNAQALNRFNTNEPFSFNTKESKVTKEDEYLSDEDSEEKKVSCIFKTLDDIRQDCLALQVIRLFQEIFTKVGLDLYVFPYQTISTRTGPTSDLGGIIEVVPNSFSRDQIGKENKYSLREFFRAKFGNEVNPLFQAARENFVKSLAAYSVASYILQMKDRHNGNILIDEYGHLIHIDFGFIFDISPGGNMRFENADFKLTQEMIDIMGGTKQSEPYIKYVDLVIRGFLAVRKHQAHFYSIIESIYESGMECFNEKSMEVNFINKN